MNGLASADEPRPIALAAVLATVAMLFATFTASYAVRRTAGDWHPVTIPPVLWASTGILAASSLVLEIGRRRREALVATLGLGVLFIGLQAAGWSALRSAGIFLSSSPHASFVYVLTAVHALHLVGGLAALAVALATRRHVAGAAIFWHFMAGVWVWILGLLSTM